MTFPAPLVPAEVDLRDFGFMPLDVLRLRDSDLAALASGEEFKAAVLLWCVAWHQVPAGSLPTDDRLLARFSGAGPAWKKVRAEALRGFIECADGRLYHVTICEKALESWEAKLRQRARTKHATEAREAKRREALATRDVERNVERDDERNVERNVVQGIGTVKGQGQGQGIKEIGAPTAVGRRPARKCPPDFVVDSGLEQWACENAPGVDLVRETAKFRDHTFSSAKTDWPGTWRNWMRKASESTRPQRAGDRIDRQLQTAALMTGQTMPGKPLSRPLEVIDCDARYLPT